MVEDVADVFHFFMVLNNTIYGGSYNLCWDGWDQERDDMVVAYRSKIITVAMGMRTI